MYSILGTYREKTTEVIADGLTKNEAIDLWFEYSNSYDASSSPGDWVLWVEKEK